MGVPFLTPFTANKLLSTGGVVENYVECVEIIILQIKFTNCNYYSTVSTMQLLKDCDFFLKQGYCG